MLNDTHLKVILIHFLRNTKQQPQRDVLMKKVMESFPSISISLSTAGKLRSFLGKFFCFILVTDVYYNDFISALILLHNSIIVY